MQKVKQFIKNPTFVAISLVLIFRVVYFFCLDYCFTPDSYEYISRDGFAWLHGSVDRYRLPVYPMLIDICKFISESHYTFLLCVFQLVVSLISVIVLYLTINRITEKKWTCLLITFLYGTFNAVSGWEKTILTESLSLSLTVFVLFGIVSYLKERKCKYIIFTTICLLIGCFLKAVFVIYLGLFFGFLILCVLFPNNSSDASARASQRKKSLKHALIPSVPLILVFLYAFTFHSLYGEFTLSDSSLGQQLHIVLENGYYQDASDDEIINVADSILNSSSESELKERINIFISGFYKEPDTPEIQKIKEQLLDMCDNKMDKNIEDFLDKYIDELYNNRYDCNYTDSTYLARLYIMENYDRGRVQQFVNESKRTHLNSYLFRIPLNLLDSYSSIKKVYASRITRFLSDVVNSSLFFLTFTIIHSLLIAFVELLSFIVILLKKKRIEWLRLGLGVYVLFTVLLSIFGTNGEFARSAITALPFVFVAIAIYLDWFCVRIIKISLTKFDSKNKTDKQSVFEV